MTKLIIAFRNFVKQLKTRWIGYEVGSRASLNTSGEQNILLIPGIEIRSLGLQVRNIAITRTHVSGFRKENMCFENKRQKEGENTTDNHCHAITKQTRKSVCRKNNTGTARGQIKEHVENIRNQETGGREY
jgi:hypothetical protein